MNCTICKKPKFILVFWLSLFFIFTLFFCKLVDEVWLEKELLPFDQAISHWVSANQEPYDRLFFLGVTYLGNVEVLALLTLLAATGLWFGKKRLESLLLIGGYGCTGISVYLLKLLTSRPRPMLPPLLHETTLAFPSGHAALALFAFGFLSYLLSRNIRKKSYSMLVFALGLAIAGLIGTSRVYLNAHWLSDVIGGFALAAAILSVCIGILEARCNGIIHFHLYTSASQKSLILAFVSISAIGLHLLLKYSFIFADLPFSVSNIIIPADDIPLLLAIIIGVPLLLQILLKLLKGDFGADLLAAVALVVAVLLSEYLTAVLIILMLAGGQALEAYAMRKASSVLEALAKRMPSIAHRKRDGQIEDIAISNIAISDQIVIYPHETCPVDGTVIDGQGSMDEAYLTGEPYRVSKAPGAAVLSGAINGEGLLVIRAEKAAIDSRYAKIMEVMEEAEQKRPALRRLGDRLGAIFAPVALVFALAAWYFTGDVIRFLSVLVIATPCPLLIAIPITVISAISMAAKRGIIIKDPTVLELLPTCSTAIFDKTGTLTYGQPELKEILPAEGISKDIVLQQAASLERYSKHPLATAILKAAEEAGLLILEAENVSEKPGQGLTGNVGGHAISITSRNKLLHLMPDAAMLLPPVGAGLECIILMDGHYAATFRLRDKPREEGKSFIGHLAPAHRFRHVMLVSGDRDSEVNYLAERLGITEVLASQSPEQKLAIVRKEVAKAPTLFMGDGINDAPALTAATVGIAFGRQTVTAEAAGAVIMESNLIKVDELMHLSISMRRIAMQSALGGMLLSIIGMGFAAAGLLPPIWGAIVQEIIDGIAILNALRMTWNRTIEIDMGQSALPVSDLPYR